MASRTFVLLLLTLGPGLAQAESLGPLVAVAPVDVLQSCVVDSVDGQLGRVYQPSQVEPRLAINPSNPRNLVATFQQDRWNGGGARGLVTAVSFDGGATWAPAAVSGTSYCAGGGLDRASDPWLAFAPNGDLYHVSLLLAADGHEQQEFHAMVPPVVPGSFNENAIAVSKSTDGGLSWGTPILVAHGLGGGLNDKETVTADPRDPRFVYVAWDRVDSVSGPAFFSRTTDGGASWSAARPIHDPGRFNQGVGHQIVVLPNGTLLDFFTEILQRLGADGTFSVAYFLSFLRSEDQGATWSGASRAFSFVPADVFDPDAGFRVRSSGALVDVAVDRSSGAVYAVWGEGVIGLASAAIVVAISNDAGETWSQATVAGRTGAISEDRQAFTPTVSVRGDGTVGITYYDFTENDPGRGALTGYRLVTCRPGPGGACDTAGQWSRALSLTEQPFDLQQAPFARGLFVGDYEGLAADGNDFLALFSVVEQGAARVVFRRVKP